MLYLPLLGIWGLIRRTRREAILLNQLWPMISLDIRVFRRVARRLTNLPHPSTIWEFTPLTKRNCRRHWGDPSPQSIKISEAHYGRGSFYFGLIGLAILASIVPQRPTKVCLSKTIKSRSYCVVSLQVIRLRKFNSSTWQRYARTQILSTVDPEDGDNAARWCGQQWHSIG